MCAWKRDEEQSRNAWTQTEDRQRIAQAKEKEMAGLRAAEEPKSWRKDPGLHTEQMRQEQDSFPSAMSTKARTGISKDIGDLPRYGPFRIRGGFIPGHLLKGFLWFLLFAVLGGGIAFYGVIVARDQWNTAMIWTSGKPVTWARFQGRVRTTNLIFKSYELNLRYIVPGRPAKMRHTKIEFFRFFVGPGKNEPYTARYLPENPDKATLSWAYEARFHGWVFAALMLGIGLLMLVGIPTLSWKYVKEVSMLRRMAKRGALIRAEITKIDALMNTETKRLEQTYHISFVADQSYHTTYMSDGVTNEPWFLEEGKALLVLAAQSGGEYWVLRHDGHPLVL